jgi:protein-disulfide isomerase
VSKKQREVNRSERAAAVRQEQAAKERNRRILITLGVVLVLSAIVAVGVIYSSGGKTEPTTPAGSVAMAADSPALLMGPDKATHKVVVYEDFLCPYCREFETATRSFLHDYARKGRVQVEYRPFHLLPDPYSTRALTAWGAVLENGTPQQAYSFHNALYDNQPYENDPNKPGTDQLVSMAKKAGVNSDKALSAMQQDNPAFVTQADQNAQKAGVKGTPTVFVDGKELQGASISDMADNLERILAQK